MKYRKFKKSDIRHIAKIKHSVFAEFCKDDYFEKGAIEWYLNQVNLNNLDDKLMKSIRITKDSICYVVEENNEIVWYINGKKNRMWNLFVLWKVHGKWVGKNLVELFEKEALKQGSNEIKINSSIYAVLFYQKMGYMKTTWVRNTHDLKIQPMKKIFN